MKKLHNIYSIAYESYAYCRVANSENICFNPCVNNNITCNVLRFQLNAQSILFNIKGSPFTKFYKNILKVSMPKVEPLGIMEVEY